MRRHIGLRAALIVLSLGTTLLGFGHTPLRSFDDDSVQANIATGFETGTTEGWLTVAGVETLTVTTDEKRSGNFSLRISNRQQTFHGPRMNVANDFANGSRYRVSVWARIVAGQAASNLRMTLQRTLAGTTTYHNVVPAVTVKDDGWTNLTTIYTYPFEHDTLRLYIESAAGTSSFYIDDFELTLLPPLQIQNDIPNLRQVLEPHFNIGAAISPAKFQGVHGQLLTKHFNSVTAENVMKWGPIHPSENTYDFAPADAIVNNAVANGMQVRGHALVWHEQNPSWLFLDANGNPMTPTPQNKALLLQRLDSHIRTVVGRYGANIYAWDVVNEVIDPNEPDGFRKTQWFQICGTDYIDKAFQVAREVSPSAKLFINDYDTTNPTKRTFLFNLIQNLRSRGIPVDGIGHQMHNNPNYPTKASIIDSINLFATIPGIDNQITEMDVSIYTNSSQSFTTIPNSVLLRQGYRYRDHFDAYRSLADKISSVTLWGLADDATWLSTFPVNRLEAPLLFDQELQAKPAYWGIVDPTRLQVTISGRVTTPSGLAIRNATVNIVDPLGNRRTVTTSSFGTYTFTGIEANGTSYIISVSSKRYRFAPKTIPVEDAMTGVDFTGLE